MANEKIVTTTGIKASEAQAKGITEQVIISKLKANVIFEVDKKDLLEVVVCVQEVKGAKGSDNQFLIYTVEERDIDTEYFKLGAEDQRIYWSDGFKRKEVNAPNHQHIKTELGLIEKSNRVQKAADGAKMDVARNMVKAGMSLSEIVRLTQLPKELVELAINEVAPGAGQAKK